MHKKKKRFLIAVIFLIGFVYLWSRSGIAQWYVASADLAREERDYTRAMQQLNRAIELQPKNPELLASRGRLQLDIIIAQKSSDFESCIADFTQAIELAPEPFGYRYLNYRSEAYQHWANSLGDGPDRRSKFELSISDLQMVLEQFEPASNSLQHATALNSISYARALANVDIAQALLDIDEALEILEISTRAQQISAAASQTYRSAWLDTRGYLRYRAGLYKQAKDDMEEAIRIIELQSEATYGFPGVYGEGISVMYFHRGKIYEVLNFENLAKVDLQWASELGYPGNGIL